ncbi:MAG: hypothetical protein K2L88_06330, partial [Clostridiales bacterium]|nr:hypothetical protein [Clostridiales bacterium]
IMMKKIVSIILAFACASTCAVGLVACGDDKTHKPHSEVEWKAAFNAELDAQYYCWWISYYEGSESDREYFVLSEFDCDAANRAYFYGTGKPKVTGNYLFKKDSSYYGSMDQSEGAFNNVEKLSPEEFTEKENGWVDLYKKFVENLLKQYRDDYSSFSYNGGIG